jgi:hypothetical protein
MGNLGGQPAHRGEPLRLGQLCLYLHAGAGQLRGATARLDVRRTQQPGDREGHHAGVPPADLVPQRDPVVCQHGSGPQREDPG